MNVKHYGHRVDTLAQLRIFLAHDAETLADWLAHMSATSVDRAPITEKHRTIQSHLDALAGVTGEINNEEALTHIYDTVRSQADEIEAMFRGDTTIKTTTMLS